ncbi:MAG: hypothetical protein COA78_10935 [Blastopirellula sp.]|nr:MAG: hypothetical protein COA78_10935 [Blastopirellula sp.]
MKISEIISSLKNNIKKLTNHLLCCQARFTSETNVNEPAEESEALTTEAFYVQRTTSPSPHYLGGPTLHSGSECPECGREVTLTWDLDLTAPDIPATLKGGYGSLQRLPLYVCSQCSVLSYQVLADDKIACFPHGDLDWCFDNESPHYETRPEIQRQPIRLYPMSPEIDALWKKHHYLYNQESLDDLESAQLQGYFDSLDVAPDDLDDYSQLCGDPYWIQRSRTSDCPNPQCKAGATTKRLAHISPTDSPGLGDSIGYFNFQFMACPACFSISVQYECT